MTPPKDHEYAVLEGVSRANVGRYLTHVSSVISGVLVFVVLQVVNLAKAWGLDVNIPPTVMSLFGASVVYGGLHWILKHHVWRLSPISKLLKVPDLAGTWNCQGESLNQDGSVDRNWSGELTIVQSWDKLRVRLNTEHSGSSSVAAALAHDSVDGWLLIYQYRNDPKAGNPTMHSHIGSANVTIARDLKTASAFYFNGLGRTTWGRMTWTRRT